MTITYVNQSGACSFVLVFTNCRTMQPLLEVSAYIANTATLLTHLQTSVYAYFYTVL